MNTELKATLIEALEMLATSNKRAQNTQKNPVFAPVYEMRDKQITDALAWVKAQKA